MVWLWNAVSRGRRLAAGSFVFVLREAFDAVGGFSERVYASEEIWLSRAVRRWGRERGLPFVILRDHPVLTSGRKARWYPTPVVLAVAVGLLVCPSCSAPAASAGSGTAVLPRLRREPPDQRVGHPLPDLLEWRGAPTMKCVLRGGPRERKRIHETRCRKPFWPWPPRP